MRPGHWDAAGGLLLLALWALGELDTSWRVTFGGWLSPLLAALWALGELVISWRITFGG